MSSISATKGHIGRRCDKVREIAGLIHEYRVPDEVMHDRYDGTLWTAVNEALLVMRQQLLIRCQQVYDQINKVEAMIEELQDPEEKKKEIELLPEYIERVGADKIGAIHERALTNVTALLAQMEMRKVEAIHSALVREEEEEEDSHERDLASGRKTAYRSDEFKPIERSDTTSGLSAQTEGANPLLDHEPIWNGGPYDGRKKIPERCSRSYESNEQVDEFIIHGDQFNGGGRQMLNCSVNQDLEDDYIGDVESEDEGELTDPALDTGAEETEHRQENLANNSIPVYNVSNLFNNVRDTVDSRRPVVNRRKADDQPADRTERHEVVREVNVTHRTDLRTNDGLSSGRHNAVGRSEQVILSRQEHERLLANERDMLSQPVQKGLPRAPEYDNLRMRSRNETAVMTGENQHERRDARDIRIIASTTAERRNASRLQSTRIGSGLPVSDTSANRVRSEAENRRDPRNDGYMLPDNYRAARANTRPTVDERMGRQARNFPAPVTPGRCPSIDLADYGYANNGATNAANESNSSVTTQVQRMIHQQFMVGHNDPANQHLSTNQYIPNSNVQNTMGYNGTSANFPTAGAQPTMVPTNIPATTITSAVPASTTPISTVTSTTTGLEALTQFMDNRSRTPNLPLTVFDGKPENWRKWWSVYSYTVHNNATMSEEEKIMHLVTNISGEAALMIEYFDADPKFYKQCIELLSERYNRGGVTRQKMFERIQSIPESSNTIADIRATFVKVLSGFKCLNTLENNESNTIMLDLIKRKFPEKYQTRLGRWVHEAGDSWTISGIMTKLDNWIVAEEAGATSKPTTPAVSVLATTAAAFQATTPYTGRFSRPQSRNNSVGSRYGRSYSRESEGRYYNTNEPKPVIKDGDCGLCLETGHHATACRKPMNLETRRATVRKNGLCYRCLSANHRSRDCVATECKKCLRGHHSSLCPQSREPSAHRQPENKRDDQSIRGYLQEDRSRQRDQRSKPAPFPEANKKTGTT